MRGYRLSLFRHGRTEANERGVYIGKTDYPLSEAGKKELIDKMDEFAYPKVDRVYCSPLRRCKETAEIIFPDRETLIINDLRELDFGDFEEKSVDELINNEEYKKWLKGGMENQAPNGESLSDLIVRSYNALDRIIRNMMDEELHNCAIVTHSGVLTNMLSCFGLPKLKPEEFSCGVGEGFEVMVTAQMWLQSQAFEILGKTPYYSIASTEVE